MAALTQAQVDALLNATIYSWDVSSQLAGIVDFLEFSERNLAWQREREVRRAQAEADALEFDDEDAHLLVQARGQIVESAELRFDVGLARSVRYAGLVAFITSIEWCMDLFAKRLAVVLPKKPHGISRAGHIFDEINTRVGGRLAEEAMGFHRAVRVRNCVVHNTGRVVGDEYEAEVRAALAALDGFGISDEGFEGPSVDIAAGAVERLAKAAQEWVPSLDRECTEAGIFKR